MMGRGKGRSRGGQDVTIETHPYNERIIPQLQVALWELDFLRDNMPTPELLQAPLHGWHHILHMLVYASELCAYGEFVLPVVKWAILTHDSGRYFDQMEESQHGLMGAYVAASMIKKGQIDVDAGKVIGVVGRHSKIDDSLSTEEAVVRTCDRLDLWRIPGFSGLNEGLMHAPGWPKVEKLARRMRLEGIL